MNQSGFNASQKKGKDSGTCEVCFGIFKRLCRDGTLSKHGFRDNPCPGYYSAPLNGPVTQPPTADVSAKQSSATITTDGKPLTPLAPSANSHTLSHPPWTTKLNRIPQSARASCRSLLTDIIERIIKSPNNKSVWNELLLFARVVITKPGCGEAKGT